jgi:hypothetical protein
LRSCWLLSGCTCARSSHWRPADSLPAAAPAAGCPQVARFRRCRAGSLGADSDAYSTHRTHFAPHFAPRRCEACPTHWKTPSAAATPIGRKGDCRAAFQVPTEGSRARESRTGASTNFGDESTLQCLSARAWLLQQANSGAPVSRRREALNGARMTAPGCSYGGSSTPVGAAELRAHALLRVWRQRTRRLHQP